MTALLPGGWSGATLALLLAAHALADFVLQTEAMVEGKGELGPTARHAGVHLALYLAAFAPVFAVRGVPVLVGLAAAHLVVDVAKGRLRDPDEPSLGLFLGDQLAHLATILVAWSTLDPAPWVLSGIVPAPHPATVAAGAVTVAAFAFNVHGGTAVVRAVLPPDPAGDDGLEAGARIGVLERWLVLPAVLAGAWSAVGLVFAAKSIARFEELRDRPFAEYYLVGTLASVLVAVLTGLAVRGLV